MSNYELTLMFLLLGAALAGCGFFLSALLRHRSEADARVVLVSALVLAVLSLCIGVFFGRRAANETNRGVNVEVHRVIIYEHEDQDAAPVAKMGDPEESPEEKKQGK